MASGTAYSRCGGGRVGGVGLDPDSRKSVCARLGGNDFQSNAKWFTHDPGSGFLSFLLKGGLWLTDLRAGPPFSWGVTSGGPPGGRSLSKDGTRAESAKDFCRFVGGVYYAGNLISD